MNHLSQSEWKLSVYTVAAMLGTFLGIFIVLRELNLIFVMIYLGIVAFIISGYAIYISTKRKKHSDEK
ncbi:hypothetical protein [Jeotgalibacillus salarius]|uniref:Uncharacterized protein n=1 Tax=Jeotgalibacillus salarius TaxID=546023 RepID=A0A4Y8LD38_9BACL|nr:hypothetical protein [Jeotgalibacillus salarius]TFE00610.1 hypothetical protein E2626_11585 [Jeotgalibacillus salarius]